MYKGQGRNLDELDDSPILGIPRSRAIIAIPYPNHVMTREESPRGSPDSPPETAERKETFTTTTQTCFRTMGEG